ncbi:tRNA (adenine-N1)-methyltransferase [uncultured Amnibacterium sp.]|uniref:tRNA (adenine-N1)-methyltransferase n=1 Tax=uncultured Amnibacterium sp. TaxID=1631851 RepID=UPI0035CC106C
MTGVFRTGDRVQLTGHKGRRNTITLAEGGVFHTHRGTLAHELLIGQPDGSVVTGSDGTPYLALKPLLTDYVMSMPRGAAIVYPKDAGQILAAGDIALGQRVVEAGVGSGALTLWLLRAVGGTGTVHSVERRAEFAEVAADNVAGFFGGEAPGTWSLSIGDLADVLDAGEPAAADRVVLDMLAPWEVVPAVSRALAPGGVVVAYIATVPQLSRVVEALRDDGAFTEPLSTETMVRGWHVDGLAVRPDHRMVAHTGFLVTARRLADGTVAPRTSRRAPKTFSDEDVEVWTPGAVGEREQSAKRLRKTARQAAEIAGAVQQGHAEAADADPGAR